MPSLADEAAEAAGPLLELLREFEASEEEATAVASALTSSQLWWRPEPDRWSVGECLDHLVRTGEAYLEVIDEAIAAGWEKRLTGRPPFRRTLLGRWFARALEPPPGLKLPAPGRIRPRRPGGPETAGPGSEPRRSREDALTTSPLPRFLALRDRLARRLGDAKGLDIGRIRVRSPFVPLVRVDLESAFRMVAAHERRHLWQARRVKEEEGFPEP